MDKVVVQYFRIAGRTYCSSSSPPYESKISRHLLSLKRDWLVTLPSPHQLSAFTPHQIGLRVDYVRCVALAFDAAVKREVRTS